MNVVCWWIWRDRGSLERQSVQYRTLVKSSFVFYFPTQLHSFAALYSIWSYLLHHQHIKEESLTLIALQRDHFITSLLYEPRKKKKLEKYDSLPQKHWHPSPSCTFQRISCESQLADDVTRDVRFDALTLFSVSFGGLQKVVKFLRVKLLQTRQHTAAGMSNVQQGDTRLEEVNNKCVVFVLLLIFYSGSDTFTDVFYTEAAC